MDYAWSACGLWGDGGIGVWAGQWHGNLQQGLSARCCWLDRCAAQSGTVVLKIECICVRVVVWDCAYVQILHLKLKVLRGIKKLTSHRSWEAFLSLSVSADSGGRRTISATSSVMRWENSSFLEQAKFWSPRALVVRRCRECMFRRPSRGRNGDMIWNHTVPFIWNPSRVLVVVVVLGRHGICCVVRCKIPFVCQP